MTVAPHETAIHDLLPLLPDIYRERDQMPGTAHRNHLKTYLNAHALLLDRLRGTIEQLHKDHFPDVPPKESPDEPDERNVCQTWVIPYLADLVGATLVSPYANGQRFEVANAIRWTKAKGTVRATAEIIDAVTQTEAELHEGFRRVLRSVVPGEPILPADNFGEPDFPADAIAPDPVGSYAALNPQHASRHPGLPGGTVRLRDASRAVTTAAGAAGSRQSRFGASPVQWPADDKAGAREKNPATAWRQVRPQAAPCFPGSYEDVSVRTVDMRSPDRAARMGRYHPRRLLVYLPPPAGFFGPVSRTVTFNSANSANSATWWTSQDLGSEITRTVGSDGVIRIENTGKGRININGNVEVPAGKTVVFTKLVFMGQVELRDGVVQFERCAVKAFSFAVSDAKRVMKARSTLFGTVSGGNGLAELEYCTTLDAWTAQAIIRASEGIFPPGTDSKKFDCLRYSSLDSGTLKDVALQKANTSMLPDFVSKTFGESGAGVLLPSSPVAVLEGAEDAGEMGCYHDWRYDAQRQALILKLADFLPMGLVPVVIWDNRLLVTPPAAAV